MQNESIVKNEAKGVKALQTDALFESLALRGDVSMLKAGDKIAYYRQLCERLGLDPMSQPFLPLKLNGKEVFYATRAATDQLARLHNVTREVISREQMLDVYIVKVRAALPSGRFEESIGAVAIGGLKGEMLANGLMKGETKAKRRATLALLGLGMLDESELDTITPSRIERVAPYQVGIDAEPSIDHLSKKMLARTDAEPSEPNHEAAAQTEEENAVEDERIRLQNRLLQEIQTLRDLGISHSEAQRQMERVTGKSKRADLTNEETDKAITSLSEWAKEIAESLREKK